MDEEDGMSPGKLITYQLYWNMLNGSYKSLLDIVTSFTRAAGAAQRVFSLMDSLPDIDIYSGVSITRDEIVGAIRLTDVTFSYQMRPDSIILDSLSLDIPAGTTCALVGKSGKFLYILNINPFSTFKKYVIYSGGGKSTIVNMIMRFYDPRKGEISLDGVDIKTLCLRDIRRQIGFVQQNTELFGGTIEENITYGLEPGSWTREEVIEAAKNACAHEFIKSFPEGYLTRVGERGVRISGGQKQRIAIARVFLKRPKILLLDEATSALDSESEAKVQEAIDKLISDKTDQRTVVLVAHRLSTVINANQIAVIGDGRILERGTHEALMKKGGEYAKLVMRQLKKKNSVLDMDSPLCDDDGVQSREEEEVR
jgi:ATP-binding cassette subfamily B protein